MENGEFEALLAPLGASFRGVIEGPRHNLILFRDLRSGSTLALPESDFSSDSISKRLAESRLAFGILVRGGLGQEQAPVGSGPHGSQLVADSTRHKNVL